MKKLIALLLALVMVVGLVACGAKEEAAPEAAPEATPEATPEAAPETEPEAEPETEAAPEVTVMTHADYVAAELDSDVVIETYVQNNQSWWDNKVTVYCQSPDGAYFLYELACSEEDAAKLVPGTKIRVTGVKGEWAGEVEVMDGTFEFVAFKGMTVKAIEYKNGEPGDDIYLTLEKDGAEYSFCVEVYLTGTDHAVYTTVGELAEGDVVDVEGFLYWYEGMNPHITGITKI